MRRGGLRRAGLSYAAVAAAAPALSYKERVLATSPLAYWTMEEASVPGGYRTFADHSGNGYDGEAWWYTLGTGVYHQASPSYPFPEWSATGFGFPGIGDGLTCFSNRIAYDGDVEIASLSGHFPGDEGSAMVWFKYVGDHDNNYDRAHCVALCFAKNYQLNRGLWINSLGGFVRRTDAEEVAVSTSPDVSFFRCLLFSWSVANNYLKAYVDGVQVGTTQTGLTGLPGGQAWAGDSSGGSWGIGNAGADKDRQCGGLVAHAAVWNAPLAEAVILSLGVL